MISANTVIATDTNGNQVDLLTEKYGKKELGIYMIEADDLSSSNTGLYGIYPDGTRTSNVTELGVMIGN